MEPDFEDLKYDICLVDGLNKVVSRYFEFLHDDPKNFQAFQDELDIITMASSEFINKLSNDIEQMQQAEFKRSKVSER